MPAGPEDRSDPTGRTPPSGERRTLTGRTVGERYRLESVLGRGGMGVVWQGRDELLGRGVAIKEVLFPREVGDAERAELRARTMREARTTAAISAVGVVSVFDVVEDDGRPWIVMELLPPRTLEDEITQRGALPPQEVAEIGAALLEGLSAAHAAGVLHRDVKPSNVMFRGTEGTRQAVLVDFGIAHTEGDASITSTGMLVGSPGFVSPERAQGKPATAPSDLWSLGITLWTAVEGRPPFHRENGLATLNAVLTEPVPPAERAGPLRPLLDGLLRKDPDLRLDAIDARDMLREVSGSDPRAGAAPALAATRTMPVGATDTARLEDLTARPEDAPPSRPEDAPPQHSPSQAAPPSRLAGAAVPPSVAPPVIAPPSDGHEDRWEEPAADHAVPARRRRRGRGPLVLGAVLAGLLVLALVMVGSDLLGGQDPGAPADAESAAPQSPEDEVEGQGEETPGAGEGEGEAPADDGGAEVPEGEAPADDDAAEEQPAEPPAEEDQPGVPEGYQRYEDPSGFSVVVPTGWTAERDGPRVYLSDPESPAYLLVDQTDEPKGDPVEDWQRQEQSVSQRLENYERIGEIEAVDYRGWEAADWQFVFGENQGTRVLNRNVVTSPDQAYALYWSVPTARWDEFLPVHEQVAAGFEPRQ